VYPFTAASSRAEKVEEVAKQSREDNRDFQELVTSSCISMKKGKGGG